MKTRFATIDIIAVIPEIRERLLGLRVVNVYDIDHKTYLIKLAKPDVKDALLFESGARLHCTDFDWPKNAMPSGFSMKLRKHIRGRRLVSVEQLGVDRIVDLQFGEDEAAYHVIIELYDRGNVVLTDYEYTILNLLRVRTDESQDVRFAVREKYPIETARQPEPLLSMERLGEILMAAKVGDLLRRVLNPHLVYGPALIENCLLKQGFQDPKVGDNFDISTDLPMLMAALQEAEEIMQQTMKAVSKGYIIQKKEKKVTASEGNENELITNVEYHPFLFKQHEKSPSLEFERFGKAVDEFYSQLGSQKLDVKALQQEKAAVKKLENVKKDHEKRLQDLKKSQDIDMMKAQLIEINLPLVDRAIQIVRSAVANQIDWDEIWDIVKEAQAQDDPVAKAIKSLKLDTNHFTLVLSDPFSSTDSDEDSNDDVDNSKKKSKQNATVKVDIDLELSAYANARKYYEHKKHSNVKEQKTIDASAKALKSAEAKTKQTLKDVATVTSIIKNRKTYWFEKYLWFITSENYLVIGGRDQQQNEIVVRKYLNKGDIYVHADLHGASSVIIKNPTGEEIPPKTLNEAGTMAICYSAAWEAKVVTSAWWVYHHQVSKTAPTGEYLTTGSFMVRGKKNYLPPSYLMMGFGFVFKVDDDSVFRHKDERKVRVAEDDLMSLAESQQTAPDEGDEIAIPEDGSSSSEDEDDGIPEFKGTKALTEEMKGLNVDGVSGDGAQDDDSRHGDKTQEQDEDSHHGDKAPEVVSGEKDVEIDRDDLDKGGEDDDEEDEDEDDGGFYPDTTIQLQHIGGEKFELQRGISRTSTMTTDSQDDNTDVVFLGDDQPIVLKQKTESGGKQRLSAKQRREMKKQKKKQGRQIDEENEEEENRREIKDEEDEEVNPRQQRRKQKGQQAPNQQQQQQQQPPPKRGQKAKLRKMKEKYADQDEEERRLKMEILASAGTNEVKGKKAKKKLIQQQQLQKAQQQQKLPQKKGKSGRPWSGAAVKLEGDIIGQQEADRKPPTQPIKDSGEISDEEKEAVLAEENIIQDGISILDSLTGQPHEEDTLMFAVPVCAPYNSMQNFKFKVKLTPGSSKRGKAAKTSLSMFQFSKETTDREKDLFKSVKDNDLSRNLPGKVKVSAPNLQKMKKKK